MPDEARRVVVMGPEPGMVGRTVRRLREAGGASVAGYVGEDEGSARDMATEMLGGVDEVVRVPGRGGG